MFEIKTETTRVHLLLRSNKSGQFRVRFSSDNTMVSRRFRSQPRPHLLEQIIFALSSHTHSFSRTVENKTEADRGHAV